MGHENSQCMFTFSPSSDTKLKVEERTDQSTTVTNRSKGDDSTKPTFEYTYIIYLSPCTPFYYAIDYSSTDH